MNNALPTTHRTTEFHKWDKEGRMELMPPYQRKPVWSLRNKSYLIDTILHSLPVPEIYLQINTDTTGNTKYGVVDGQQRIRAILEFIEGAYAILEDQSKEFGGKRFADLDDDEKTKFWDYQLVVRELKTSSEEEIREIFQRLNKYSVPLNPQELRHSTYTGDFIKLVEELGVHPFWIDNKILSPSSIRRYKDAEFVSELLIGTWEGVQQQDSKNLDRFYQKYDARFRDRDRWQKHFIYTMLLIQDIFGVGKLRGTHWNKKIDFYALFITISELLKSHNIPISNRQKIKEELVEFRRCVNVQKENATSKPVRDYFETIHGAVGNKDKREKRTRILKDLLMPYLIAKDPQRSFTREQIQYVWDKKRDKLCGVCGKSVEWQEYECDHILPHTNGGMTAVENARITHRSCNRSRRIR